MSKELLIFLPKCINCINYRTNFKSINNINTYFKVKDKESYCKIYGNLAEARNNEKLCSPNGYLFKEVKFSKEIE